MSYAAMLHCSHQSASLRRVQASQPACSASLRVWAAPAGRQGRRWRGGMVGAAAAEDAQAAPLPQPQDGVTQPGSWFQSACAAVGRAFGKLSAPSQVR